MFHSRHINTRINKLHERALRVVYKDEKLTFNQLLEKDNSFTIHERNLQKLALLMFKVKNESFMGAGCKLMQDAERKKEFERIMVDCI